MNAYPLRAPCRWCGATAGRLEPKSGQNCVYCISCGRLAYNAPKVETGEAKRSVTTVHNGIKPSVRNRILERDGHRCVCGATGADGILVVDHILSVKDGLGEGFTEAELNDDVNLMTLCEECNAGKGEKSRSLRWYMTVLLRLDLRTRGAK